MSNGLTRLETRFLGEPEAVEAAKARKAGEMLDAEEADELGLVSFALTISTGKTRCASSSKSAPASLPMR
jgi:hypothetical protein